MALNPRTASLTAINEAIAALDYESPEQLETDELTAGALELLMTARDMLTDRPWPEMAARALDVPAFEAWHAQKADEQRRDGRL